MMMFGFEPTLFVPFRKVKYYLEVIPAKARYPGKEISSIR